MKFVWLKAVAMILVCSAFYVPEPTNHPYQWNFSTPVTYSYLLAEQNLTVIGQDTSRSLLSTATIDVQVKDETSADLIIQPTAGPNYWGNATEEKVDPASAKLVLENMQRSGEFDSIKNDCYQRVLFPLPDRKLNLGETHTIPTGFHISMGGFDFQFKGNILLSYNGKMRIDKKNIALFKAEFRFKEATMPDNLTGVNRFGASMSGTYHFDTDHGHFVSSEINMNARLTPIEHDTLPAPQHEAMKWSSTTTISYTETRK